jgi:spermidine synthase
VIDIVRNDLHLSNKLVAVDIDPVIIEIARQEFALDSYENTEIICADAYEYIEKEAGEYGLIIIDLFIDNKVPEKFYGDIFWGHISRILSQNGQIIFNTMIENNSRELFDTLTQNLENKGFLVTIHEKVAGSNVMMIMKRK